MSTFLFQDKPFDRHDWYVSNDTQKEKRYVLDFYMTDNAGRGDGMMMPRVEIDVFALHVRNTETRDSQKIQLPPYSSCKERVESERVESE